MRPSLSSSALSKHPMFSQFSQLSQRVDDRKPCLYFVLPPGKTAEQCQNTNLGEMFEAAEAHFLNVMWIADDDCMTIEIQEDGNVFIFDPFGSPGFQYIQGLLSDSPRTEILSPIVLRQVLEDPQQYTFETKNSPVYTLAMKGMVICLSGFKDKAVKEELDQLVKWMNGTLSASLTKAVTNVVAATAITPKCIEAHKEKIPVMTADWIRQVFKDNRENPVSASDSRYVDFLCPIFYKVTISMSQITAVKKGILKTGIESQGGKVLAELVKNQVDVLVAQNASGDKVRFAQKWKLKCVTPQWVENSIEKGHLLPLEDYMISDRRTPVCPDNDLGPVTSTPAHSIMPDWNMTRCSVIVDDEKLVVDATKLSFTKTSSEIHEETMAQLRSIPNRPYLDGCKIFVVEYEKCDELKRELNKSGATRMNQLCDGVTHVIVTGPKLPKAIIDKINELESTPHLVTIGWVAQSAKEGSPADEEQFKFEQENTLCQETNAQTNVTMSSRVGRVSATNMESIHELANVDPSGNTSLRRNTATSDKPSTGTFNGDTSKSTSVKSNETPKDNAMSLSSKSKGSNSRNRNSENEDSDPTQEGNSVSENSSETENDSTSQGQLAGFMFKLVIADEEDFMYVKNRIEEFGGSVVTDNADVVILDPVCDAAEKNRAEKSYTKHWLFQCLDAGALDIENSFCHLPLPSFRGMELIMKGVVIAVSQYSALERDYINHIAQAMGARYQEVFARTEKDGNLKSTHLICNNVENAKSKAAKKWNVPVVVAEWLTDSFKERKRLDEHRYDPMQCNSSNDQTHFMPTPQRRKSANVNALNNVNVSGRSIYPPSTQKKAAPSAVLTKKQKEDMEMPPPPPQEPIPSTSKQAAINNPFQTPPSKKKHDVEDNIDSTNPTNNKTPNSETLDGDKDDKLERWIQSLPGGTPLAEIQKKMAELKAQNPFSDESFDKLLEDVAARGINLDDIPSFTSEEENRLCNPDSPLLLGLPRHESRSLKEQFEIAINRTPNIPKITVKTPKSTPLWEIRRRFNEAQAQISKPESDAPKPVTSTPKTDLRRVATMNRFSQGNLNTSQHQSNEEDDGSDVLSSIRRLGNKRPSDGSPSDEESKSSKRARTSSNEDSDVEDIIPKNPSSSPNENHVPASIQTNEKPTSSKKANNMQVLTNLIAESQQNTSSDAACVSPIKRRSAGNGVLIACDEVHEEIEQPHIGWGDEERNEKGSTVKKATGKPRINAVETVDCNAESVEVESNEKGGRKRSSRLKKTSSVVSLDEGCGRVTRQTRARSRSKSRKEDSAPMGHKPIKMSEGKKTRKKKSASIFPIELPENPVFLTSSLDQKEKAEAQEIIRSLGGTCSKANTFDVKCHAVITTKMLRSEKILASIASGKPILKFSYLKHSEEAQRFVPIEEEHVWLESDVKEDKEVELVKASIGWLKLLIEKPEQQPMTGMKFCIVDQPPEKMKAFMRLIEASGGEVVANLNEATLVIKDEKSNTVVPKRLPVQNPVYLNTLILTVPET